ncbi:protein NOI4-like [Rhodamnia argentea]|uniref:Protein NOI4-like n=1 Tax=Rhodamnia argentea TaxID=178133 RepID=A0A8B8Q575_9MYRT|nr:protein NOI4-like [Rhodamnia argentea]
MASAGRPLPKFGEWDVNNPASAEGFTVIFNKARDEKKTSGTAANMVSPRRNVSPRRTKSTYSKNEKRQQSPKRKWLCCG